MHFKRVRFADADKVVGGLPHFSEHVSDDEFVPEKQPNDDPPALHKNLAESVESSYSISLADLPKMHRALDHPSCSQFAHILRQALNVDTLPKDLQDAADLVHDHCVICVESGLTTATTDKGLLIMTSGEQVVGVLALHVDDAIGGGTEELHGLMTKIGENLDVGSHDTSNFRYKGLRESTVFKGGQTVFEINVDGDDYLASCWTMDVPLGEDTDLLPPQSMTDYRSVVGTIGYASSEFRPDLAWEPSSLSRQIVTSTTLDAKRANAALQCAQKNRVILKYRRGVENRTMFHDGSLGNLDDGKSQGGRIACLTNKTGHSVAS
jgi:hypothetical protein